MGDDRSDPEVDELNVGEISFVPRPRSAILN